jgi:nitrate/nitrite-specific signal transduction histidine kinase
LRWQLTLRTLVPLGLLVVTFALVGQIGYTQVTESLARSRDTEIAKIESSRVGDYMLDSVRSLQQLANAPVLHSSDPVQIFNSLREEALGEHFDLVQVADKSGRIIAASDATQGGSLLNMQALEILKGPGLPMVFAPGKMKTGGDAAVLSIVYNDTSGAFAGIVEGAMAVGSSRLGVPLRDTAAGVYGANVPVSASGYSYLVAGNGEILWHPDSRLSGSTTRFVPTSDAASVTADAVISTIDNERYIVGYAPLNIGQLLTRAKVDRPWVVWFVVTQHRWNDVVAPVNALLYWLLILAFSMFFLAVVLVARSSGRLTVPVSKLVSAAQAVSAGRLKHRLDLLDISGPSEIEELAGQFNLMAAQLDSSYASLEKKVSDRTRELADANSELGRRLRESQTMTNVSANLAGRASLEEILEVIATSAFEALDAGGSVVLLPSDRYPGDLEVAVAANMPALQPGERVSIEKSLSGRAFRTGRAQLSRDVAQEPEVDQEVARRVKAVSTLSVPLILRGQVIGVINTINKSTGEFGEDDLRVLTLLANQAAVAVERARLYSEARKQVATLETLNELSLSVTASGNVQETLVGGMEHIGKLLSASGAVVYLADEKRRALDYMAGYNLHPAHEQVVLHNRTLYVDRDYGRTIAALEAYRDQTPCVISDMGSPDYVAAWSADFEAATGHDAQQTLKDMEVRALIALPLTVRDKALGAITLYFRGTRVLQPFEIQLFQSFANILALAVYNTQLVAQTSKLATVEERARLARELHDSVTQSLFSLNLTLKAARRNLSLSPEKADHLLDSVQELAQGALAEMRALIFELRPQALANEGLVSALQKHADSVRARSGLNVKLSFDGDRRLPLEVEEALYQIAREALHNVVKHAQAAQAWVSLDLGSQKVRLEIRDDGRGFDSESRQVAGGSHIGVSTMRERAETIGAELEIKSCAGCGTEIIVQVDVPLDYVGAGAMEEALPVAGESDFVTTE